MRTSTLRRSPSPLALVCLMVARQFSGRTDTWSVHDRASAMLAPLARLSRSVASLPSRINAALAAFLERFVNLILSIANTGTIHFAQAGISTSPDGAVCLSAPPVPCGWTSLDLDTDNVPAVCADTMTDPLPPASFLETLVMTSTAPPVEPDVALSLSPDHKDIGGRTADYYSLLRKSDREWATRHLPLTRGADGTLSPALLTVREWDNGARAAIMADPVPSPDDSYSLPVPAPQVPSPAIIALEPSIAPVQDVLPAAPPPSPANGHASNGKAKKPLFSQRKSKVKVDETPGPDDREARIALAVADVRSGLLSGRQAAEKYGVSRQSISRFIARNPVA